MNTIKKFKKAVALMLTAALLLSVGCTKKDRTPIEVVPEGKEHDGVLQRAKELTSHSALPDVTVDEQIKFLSWYNVDETIPTAEIFKAKYGIPGHGFLGIDIEVPEDLEERRKLPKVIKWEQTSYNTRYERLNSLIMSGDSPDMFPFEERNYPNGVWKKHFQTIDGVIDLDDPIWASMRDTIDLFKWAGKNYCAVTELSNSTAMLYYRRSVAQEAGLDDPYTLWRSGEWTWDTFRTMLQKFSEVDKSWGIQGTYVDEATVLSTGVGLISIENGVLKNNLDDSRVERAMSFVQDMAINDWRFPYHQLTDFQITPSAFRSGTVLFWCDGPWVYTETLQKIRDNDSWTEDEICIVPFPRDPLSNQYFQRGKQDALMLVAGAQNIDGFKAWTMSAAIAAQDAAMLQQNRDKLKKDWGYTDKQLKAREDIIDTLVPVWDFKNGIGEDLGLATGESPVENLTKMVYMWGESYTQMRSENRAKIDLRIIEINDAFNQ